MVIGKLKMQAEGDSYKKMKEIEKAFVEEVNHGQKDC